MNNAGTVGAAMDDNAFIAEVNKKNGVSSFRCLYIGKNSIEYS